MGFVGRSPGSPAPHSQAEGAGILGLGLARRAYHGGHWVLGPCSSCLWVPGCSPAAHPEKSLAAHKEAPG